MTSDDVLARETARLLTTVDSMGPDDLAAPSALPGWTRGHVLAHIAGNAEGLGRRARSVGDDVPRAMYESPETRGGDIDMRSRRSVAQHREALAATHADFLFDLDQIPADRADDQMEVRLTLRVKVGDLPLLRLQEVCIHHSDLGMPGYDWSHWPPELVAWALPRVTASFAARDDFPVGWVEADGTRFQITADESTGVSGSGTEVLAWLVGRAPGDGLAPTGIASVPAAPTWL